MLKFQRSVFFKSFSLSRPLLTNCCGSIYGSCGSSSLYRSHLWSIEQLIRDSHNWRSQMNYNNQKRKIVPKLVYLHNPWKYCITKFNLFKLQLFWDRSFVESEFIRGTKQVGLLHHTLMNTLKSQTKQYIPSTASTASTPSTPSTPHTSRRSTMNAFALIELWSVS